MQRELKDPSWANPWHESNTSDCLWSRVKTKVAGSARQNLGKDLIARITAARHLAGNGRTSRLMQLVV